MMKNETDKRNFSAKLRNANSPFLPKESGKVITSRVAFFLQNHFSMVSFTAAVDALVTANLVEKSPLYSYEIFSIDGSQVVCDLGISVTADRSIDEISNPCLNAINTFIVCGGFRCSTEVDESLIAFLNRADSHKVALGGLWNGVIPLAYAGLLDNLQCSVHPDNRAFIQERFPLVLLSENAFTHKDNRISSTGPVGTLDMMIDLIEKDHGPAAARAIEEILVIDRMYEIRYAKLPDLGTNADLPKNLREAMELMALNIEEPLGLDELSEYTGISRRQNERLFRSYLGTSPQRYYLELRITRARQLLIQTSSPLLDIAVACGFSSVSHFSNCFKKYFSMSPTSIRSNHRKNAMLDGEP